MNLNTSKPEMIPSSKWEKIHNATFLLQWIKAFASLQFYSLQLHHFPHLKMQILLWEGLQLPPLSNPGGKGAGDLHFVINWEQVRKAVIACRSLTLLPLLGN